MKKRPFSVVGCPIRRQRNCRYYLDRCPNAGRGRSGIFLFLGQKMGYLLPLFCCRRHRSAALAHRLKRKWMVGISTGKGEQNLKLLMNDGAITSQSAANATFSILRFKAAGKAFPVRHRRIVGPAGESLVSLYAC